jgi:hypothetical protein
MKVSISTSFFSLLINGISIIVWLTGCQADTNNVSAYFDKQEQDTLLTNMITYMAGYAPGATNETRFAPKFRSHYTKQIPKYSFEGFHVGSDSVHYFFVIRPVGSGTLFQRGVGGRFKLRGDLKPVDFEEMWCTPHIKDRKVIVERGGFLFRKMVQNVKSF